MGPTMPFGEHLEELRFRLWRALIGFAFVLLMVFVLDAVGFATNTDIGLARRVLVLLAKPLEQELHQLAPKLKVLSPTEGFSIYFKVALATSFAVSSPWVFWQLWSFVAAGLYPGEKRLVHLLLPFSLGLFLLGAMFCQFLVMPKAVAALVGFNDWLGLDTELRLSEWIGFAVWMPLMFGLSFQTPLVMRMLNRLGMVDRELLRSKRSLAWFILAVVAAILTPTVDIFPLLLLWIPLGILYEVGIFMCDGPAVRVCG